MVIGNSEGEGVSIAKIEFPGGWEGSNQKKTSLGGMDISWNHTLQGYVNKIVGEKEELAIETRINNYVHVQSTMKVFF